MEVSWGCFFCFVVCFCCRRPFVFQNVLCVDTQCTVINDPHRTYGLHRLYALYGGNVWSVLVDKTTICTRDPGDKSYMYLADDRTRDLAVRSQYSTNAPTALVKVS